MYVTGTVSAKVAQNFSGEKFCKRIFLPPFISPCQEKMEEYPMAEATEVPLQENLVVESAPQHLCGGYTPTGRKPGESETSMLLSFKNQVEEKMNKSYSRFEPKSVKTQVVAGTNYDFTVSVNLDNEPKEELKVRVFKPLPHTQAPPSLLSVSPNVN